MKRIISYVIVFAMTMAAATLVGCQNKHGTVPREFQETYVLESYNKESLDYTDLVEKVNGKKTEGTGISFNDTELSGLIDRNYNAISNDLNSLLKSETEFINFRILSIGDGVMVIESSINDNTSPYVESLGSPHKRLVKSKICDKLAIKATTKLDMDNAFDFIESKISVNGVEDTTEISRILNFDFNSELAGSINRIFFDFILTGERSLYKTMTSKPGIASFKLIDEEIEFEIYYIDLLKDYTIEYLNTKGVENENRVSFKASDESFDLVNLSKDGYSFLGFFNENDKKITTINPMLGGEYKLTCKWETIEYKINYDYNGGTQNPDNPITYTIESDDFTISPVEKEGGNFKGWIINGVDRKDSITISKGSFGDLNLFASFDGEKKNVTVKLGNSFSNTYEFVKGEPIIKSELDEHIDLSSAGLAGFVISNYYKDSSLTQEYDLTSALENDITLYAEKHYIVDRITFYDYIDEFENARITNKVSVDSFEKLVAYIDYVRFYNITEQVEISIDYEYDSNSISEEIQIADRYIVDREYFENGSIFAIGEKNGKGIYFVNESYREKEAKKIMDPENTMVYEKVKYGIRYEVENKRSEDFNDFKVEKIEETLKVSSSEQLVWALLNGYNPKPVVGSKAYIVFEEAKEVLRNIIGTDYSDIEKIEAIYIWLIENNSYDNMAFEALKGMDAREAKEFDSWFAEGIFLSHRAVCEGFAKAMVILSRIEGIPCITQTGNGHEWNKVMIDGKWYVIDATHGNLSLSDKKIEVVDFSNFLISDEVKSLYGYSSIDFEHIEATESYNYFENKVINTAETSGDLSIETQAEILNFMDYLKEEDKSGTDRISIVVSASKDVSGTMISMIKLIAPDYGMNLSSYVEGKYTFSNYVYILIFTVNESE